MCWHLAIHISPLSLVPMAPESQTRLSPRCIPVLGNRKLMFSSMDAISFVLGIKSSHLRSSHLRDLVYRGRVLRTSTINTDGSANAPGAGGQTDEAKGDGTNDDAEPNGSQAERNDPKSAWVMAVYEDDAGEEVLWKRTITSQGTSEYRIGKKIVTAQQYNTALEAENILIRARNFLVFQGDVEAIASQSPKDLTRLIEQISGSLEYKAEYEKLKEASTQAAEQKEAKFNRRRNINGEIRQFQEQKKEADNFAKKSKQRDHAIMTQVLWRLFHFQRVMDTAAAEMTQHQGELEDFRGVVKKFEEHLETARRDQAKVGRDVGKTERVIKENERNLETTESSLVPIDEKIEITNRSLQTYATKSADIVKEKDSQAKVVEKLQSDLGVVNKAQTKWENEWNKSLGREGQQLNAADLHEYNRLREQVNSQTSINQAQMAAYVRQQKTEQETIASLKSSFETAEWQAAKLEQEMSDITERRDRMHERAQQTSKDLDAKKKELANVTSERLRTAQKQTELDEKLQEVLRKLLEADDGRRQSEKETRTRETIAALKRIYPGVKGRVGDLCKPKMKKYHDAVGTVLGRNFDSVIVDTEKTAKECIQYLHDQRAGQATFIPLDTIQVKVIDSNLRGLHSGMRLAVDTVEYDNSLDRAMAYACGNAMVCDTLKVAKVICYEKGIEAKAVTLDGTVIHKGGLMTGGRGPGHQNSRRFEDTEIENLRVIRDQLMGQLAALPKGNRRATAEETLQGELIGLEQRINFAKDELKGYERNIQSKKKELAFAQKQVSDSKPKLESKQRELQNLEQSLETVRNAIGQVEDEVYGVFCSRLGYGNIREYEAQQGSRQQEAAQKRLEFTLQKSRLENQLTFESQRLQSTKERLQRIADRSKTDERLIAELEKEKVSAQKQLDITSARVDQLNDQLKKQKETHASKAEKVAEQRRKLQSRLGQVDSTLKTIADLEAESHRNAAGRYTMLRRCRLEEIKIPLLKESASLDKLPVDELLANKDDSNRSDGLDAEGDTSMSGIQAQAPQDYGIKVDFDELKPEFKKVCIVLGSRVVS